MKRVLDLICALVLLFILSPVMVLAAVLIKLRMGSPVIFKQHRSGLYGRPFLIWKFRTMHDERGENSKLLSAEARLTSLGRFLRRWSIDELPQLVNVAKGDMSLVGPRPLMMEYLPLYSAEEARRHNVKPGITGWAQVHGRNAISWEEKFALDVWYVDNQSLLLDIKILLMTVLQVLKKTGIDQDGNAVGMERFRGLQDSTEYRGPGIITSEVSTAGKMSND